MNYFVPSKTFLVGEYSVLVGGEALGLATNPCFRISYDADQTQKMELHHHSPASRYLTKHQLDFNIYFEDPYKTQNIKGGFGKSTAEYFAVILPDLLKEKKTIQQIRDEYLDFFSNEKIKPSGIDLIFQYLGGIAWADSKNQIYKNFDWPFPDLDFFIISTGIKIATHDHLKNLNLELIKDLPRFSNKVIESFKKNDQQNFLNSLKEWSNILNKNNLTHENALNIQADLQEIKNVLTVKPCGALGADVMIVFFYRAHKNDILNELKIKKINIQASVDDLAEGLVRYVG